MITAIAPTTPPIMGTDAKGAWVGGDAVVAGRVVKAGEVIGAVVAGRVVKASMAGEVMVIL